MSNAKLNCWEYNKCQREVGGEKIKELGICPVPLESRLDGFNGGKNAGRSCWAIAGTLCGGKPRGTMAKKLKDCMLCSFHQLVIKDEGDSYTSVATFLKKSRTDEKRNIFKEPSFLQHVYLKSKIASEEAVDSLYITLLIAWTSLCPSISMLEGSKRLCKDDLVDELMIIDAVSDMPNARATRLFFKTIFKSIHKQVSNYFEPLLNDQQ
ncbi:two-CW domain-containing protein [Candidatus Magnetomonas plexicatena]|uniref:two-CW domain-containing protein n=1 Tax=Candidatus Magnetomonas plexicatena TaxID=2552947 RepID=UPI0040328977